MRSGGFRVTSRLAQVKQPVLLLWGQQDRILEPSTAPKLAAALPAGARLRMVEACGHCAHLEQPAVVRDEMLAFMK